MSEHTSEGGFHPHVSPLWHYFAVFATLIALTGLTVVQAKSPMLDFGAHANLVIAMLIAGTKGTLVALIFMHLLYDNKLYAITLIGSILFLLTLIVMTMFDTMTRASTQPERGAVPGQVDPDRWQVYERRERGEKFHHGEHGDGSGDHGAAKQGAAATTGAADHGAAATTGAGEAH